MSVLPCMIDIDRIEEALGLLGSSASEHVEPIVVRPDPSLDG